MHTDPLTLARYPDSTDSPDVSGFIQQAVNDLSDHIGGNFTSTSARDAAYVNWVAQGNTMANGLQCRVAGFPQVYRSGAWRGVSSQLVSTITVDTTLQTGNATLMTLTVPDPQCPYKLQCSAQIIFGVVGPGVTAGGRIRVNGTDLIVGNDAVNSTGSNVNNLLTTIPPGTTGTLTGASTVTVFISKTGTAGNGYQATTAGGLGLYNILTALAVPV